MIPGLSIPGMGGAEDAMNALNKSPTSGANQEAINQVEPSVVGGGSKSGLVLNLGAARNGDPVAQNNLYFLGAAVATSAVVIAGFVAIVKK